MLEDFTMEKKPLGRSVQVPVKGSCAELKKGQELAGANKLFPRTVRRREPGPFSTSKNDCGRKYTPQKSRCPDKRARSKGQFSGAGKEDPKVGESPSTEFGAVALSGKRKQNLNHLLNFHYAPREGGVSAHSNWRQGHVGWGRRSITTHKHKYNKEQFLQANCQFVVRHTNDYMECMANPDLLVNWDCIEQINFRTTENLSCPICLYPPNAAKMTRCGHIFCWSCILHYLALSDKHFRKCPICFEPVDKFDLKSVVVMKHTQYLVGDEIHLRLMKREKGSLMPVPVDNTHPVHNKLLSVSEKELDTTYSKLLLATPKEILAIISRERTELERQLIEEMGCPERCFTEQAMELLKEREMPLSKDATVCRPFPPTEEDIPVQNLALGKSEVKMYLSSWDDNYTTSIVDSAKQQSPTPKSVSFEFEDTVPEDTNRRRYESVSSEGFGSDDGLSSLTIEDMEIPSMMQSTLAPGLSAPKFFYFYQAIDGQHVYLHAINVRMLEHQYGNLEHCPQNLKGRIVEKENGSMTEELRHRLRYLQHLPVTCQFEVVEIQLKPPIVSRNIMELFQDQLESRKRHRQRRARDERRREKRINEEEKRRMGRYPSPSICLGSHRQFPLCGTEADFMGFSVPSSPVPLSSAHSPVEQNLSASMSALSVEESMAVVVEDNADSSYGPSFAQMLREGKSRGPAVGAAEHRRIEPRKEQINAERNCCPSDGEQELEGYVPVPEYHQFLSEAISKAMEKAAEVKDSTQDVTGTGKKNKKKKQKVLFATGMAYNIK